jgi:hypothetical protein
MSYQLWARIFIVKPFSYAAHTRLDHTPSKQFLKDTTWDPALFPDESVSRGIARHGDSIDSYRLAL